MKQLMIIFPIIQIFSTKHYKCSSVPFHSLESITPANSQIEEESSSDGTFAQKKRKEQCGNQTAFPKQCESHLDRTVQI